MRRGIPIGAESSATAKHCLQPHAGHQAQGRLHGIQGDAFMVITDVPGQKWEVEFFADGDVELELFKSDMRNHVGICA
jgi:hypothetical protein